jgi:signal transduction histidine kinase
MSIFSNFSSNPVLGGIMGIWLLAFLILIWIWRCHEFEGKKYFIISFLSILWWVFALGMEIYSTGLQWKLIWAHIAWPSIAILPIAWCLYIEKFVRGRDLTDGWLLRSIIIGVPLVISIGVATNPFHHFMFTEETALSDDGASVDYAHGIFFYGAAILVYPFVIYSVGLLIRGVMSTTGSAKSLLLTLIIITIGPLSANAAYVLTGFTAFGVDPTAMMFSLGLIAFSWMLVTNRILDTKALGRDALFHYSNDPVLIVDRDHKIISWNDAAIAHIFLKKPLDLSLIERIPVSISAFVSKLDPSKSAILGQPLVASDRVYEPRAIQLKSPFDPAGRRIGWSVTFFDITDRAKFEESLKFALADAENAALAKDNFLAVVSHELRTPMTSLKGGLDLALSGKLGVMPASINKPLVIAQRNANRLSRLINDVLDVQKIELNQVKLKNESIDIVKLLQDALDENSQMARSRHVELIHEYSKYIYPFVTADAFRLRQVVDNVISNAIKFSPVGGGSINTSIQFIDNFLRLSVRDYGRGIASGNEKVVFGLFSQIDGSDTRSGEGTGLGMYISRRLMEQMGGRLHYEDAESQGTIFHIDLPFQVVGILEEINSG